MNTLINIILFFISDNYKISIFIKSHYKKFLVRLKIVCINNKNINVNIYSSCDCEYIAN